MKLKVGCGEWGFRQLPMERHFEICRELGFKSLEIGIGGELPGRLSPRLTPGEIASFRALGERFGIATPFCCLENDFTLPDAAAHAANLEECLTQMKLAADLGCRQVRLFAGFTPYAELTEAIWARLLAAFDRADQAAAELRLTIAIETHGRIEAVGGTCVHVHTATTHREGLRRLLAGLPARIGFNYDPGNLKAAAPEDRRYAWDLLDSRINYCHLKDWIYRGPGFVPAAPGDDDLDYGRLLPQLSYAGVYLIEYEPTGDVLDGLRRSLAYLRRNFTVEMG